LESDGMSFTVCFKRKRTLLGTNDLLIAYSYVESLPFRHNLLVIYWEAQCLRRIWVIDPELIAGLLPCGEAANAFNQNRAGVHLECECGAYVYIGRCTAGWRQKWTTHLNGPPGACQW
jgi:hypothetical protein